MSDEKPDRFRRDIRNWQFSHDVYHRNDNSRTAVEVAIESKTVIGLAVSKTKRCGGQEQQAVPETAENALASPPEYFGTRSVVFSQITLCSTSVSERNRSMA